MIPPPAPQPLGLQSVDPDAFRRWQDESRLIDSMQVVFIVGPQRTGTSWLTHTLQGHPNAASQFEGCMVSSLLSRVIPQIRAFNLERPDFVPFCRLEGTDQAMLARQFLDRQLLNYVRIAQRERSTQILAVVDKTPPHAYWIDDLSALYPNGKFICCTRDVRDAAVSLYHMWRMNNPGQSGDLLYSARWYAQHTYGRMIQAARASAGRLQPGQYTETAYEDRKASPHREVERLLRFIGLDASSEMVCRCVEAGDFKRLTGREPGQEAQSLYRKGTVGDWRNHLTPGQGEELLALAASALREPTPV